MCWFVTCCGVRGSFDDGDDNCYDDYGDDDDNSELLTSMMLLLPTVTVQ